MADTIPSSGDRTVVVHRYGALTWISLAFNALILLLILIGIVCHHHRRDQNQRGAWGGHCERQDRGGHGPRDFDRHDGPPMNRDWQHRDFGGPRDENRGPGDDDGHGPGMENHGGWDNKPGFGGPGFDGQMGADHFKPITPSGSEAMTDRFMLFMTDKLALTDPESAQIRPVVEQQIAQFQKDMETQKAAHQKMIDDAKAKIRPILTPDQQKQFDEMTAGLGTPAPAPPEKAPSK